MKTLRTVSLPRHVQKRSTSDENSAYAHSLEIVEFSHETSDVTAKTQVDLAPVVFENRFEVIVVAGLAIGKLVEENSVGGVLAPVCW